MTSNTRSNEAVISGAATTTGTSGSTRTYTKEEKATFRRRLEATRNEHAARQALAIAGLISEEAIVCPKCKRPAPRGKFKIHEDGGWKHFSSLGCYGDAVGVLTAVDVPFGDAVRVLNGLPTRTEIAIPDDVADLAQQFVGIRSVVNPEIFNGVLAYGRKTGGLEAAQEFYGQWHISAQAVADWGAVYITDPQHFREAILKRFGLEALLACGLFVETKRGPYCLISAAHPVVEPHRHPATGDVLYMQLRASNAQHLLYLEHKRDPKKFPYKGRERFISLKGAPREAQIGAGLHLIEQLPVGSTVHIVEGFKDGLAIATLGGAAYAVPGVDFRPSEKICQLLARHRVLVAFDGDGPGIDGRDGKVVCDDAGNPLLNADGTVQRKGGLVQFLREAGVDAHPEPIGPGDGSGLDVTDYLVSGFASGHLNGGVPCSCSECELIRNKLAAAS